MLNSSRILFYTFSFISVCLGRGGGRECYLIEFWSVQASSLISSLFLWRERMLLDLVSVYSDFFFCDIGYCCDIGVRLSNMLWCWYCLLLRNWMSVPCRRSRTPSTPKFWLNLQIYKVLVKSTNLQSKVLKNITHKKTILYSKNECACHKRIHTARKYIHVYI